MTRLLHITLITVFTYCVCEGAVDSNSKAVATPIEDVEFHRAAMKFFLLERAKPKSKFAEYPRDFMKNKDRIVFGAFWHPNRISYNCIVMDREKMKYEYNYRIYNTVIKIYGDIKRGEEGLYFTESKSRPFMHINRR